MARKGENLGLLWEFDLSPKVEPLRMRGFPSRILHYLEGNLNDAVLIQSNLEGSGINCRDTGWWW